MIIAIIYLELFMVCIYKLGFLNICMKSSLIILTNQTTGKTVTIK